jgi:hypothetical protein
MRGQFIALALVATAGLAQESRPAAFDASDWQSLFDGKTLEGWVTKGGRYDGDAAWTVEDHAICGREGEAHAGGLLYTKDRYTCFILSLDVWMTRPNDSGIFVRMAPEGRGAQITLDDREDGEVGAVYADEFLSHNTKARWKWKASAWNRVEVRVTGGDLHIEAWINGEKVSDHQILPGTGGFAPTGLIGLQVHGSRSDPPGTVVKFRDVRIRELPLFDTAEFTCDENGVMTPTEAGAKNGWKPLFNGRDLAGWEIDGPGDGFRAAGGVLSVAKGEGGVLKTAEDYENFDLKLDFRLEPAANSGLFLRAARSGENPAFSGCEIQLLDDWGYEALTQTKLKPAQMTGSIYGSAPPRVKGMLWPDGRWNSMRIRYAGSQLQASLNGVTIQDADVNGLQVPEKEKKFAERAKTGFIGIQRHAPKEAAADPYAQFRNVFIRRVP